MSPNCLGRWKMTRLLTWPLEERRNTSIVSPNQNRLSRQGPNNNYDADIYFRLNNFCSWQFFSPQELPPQVVDKLEFALMSNRCFSWFSSSFFSQQGGFGLWSGIAEGWIAEAFPNGEDKRNLDAENEHSTGDSLDGYYWWGKWGTYNVNCVHQLRSKWFKREKLCNVWPQAKCEWLLLLPTVTGVEKNVQIKSKIQQGFV